MLKYVFAALLLAAVWTTVLLLELPLWVAIVSTVVILVVLGSIVLYKIVRARKAAREIERALEAQAAAQAASARPDLQADINALQAEFIKAIGALKASKLGGKSGGDALYALPWYVIIGPPGAGKSTALRNSGLRFPYLSASGGGVQGVGGTRNCQWWMTNEAVILDTAGRYTTEDADREEWFAFLDLVKKNRPKQPINGVLVAIPVTDLAEAHPEAVLARAREIRARIDEVMGRLEMVLPVYVLFTKCDLLPGFVETFEDLGPNDRGQIWGFTAPIAQRRNPGEVFKEHFDELAQIIEQRAIRRMTEERRTEARDRIYAFPQYFEPLGTNLAMFVGEMMAESVYTESPIFRGAYFTSGTQEGRPIDRIMSAVAEAFGIQPRMATTEAAIEAKSYFLGDVFSKVVFPDRRVATRSAARLRRQALMAHGIAALLLLFGVGLAVLPALGFENNRELLARTAAALDRVQEHYDADTVAPIRIEQVEPLRAVERDLTTYENDGPPFALRMGMYQGDKLASKLRDLYIRTVREQLVTPLLRLEVKDLEKFVQKYAPTQDQPPQAEHDEAKNTLRLYLLLTGPWDEREPGLDEEQRAWLTAAVVELWAEPLEMAGDVASNAAMSQVAEAYVEILAAHPDRYLLERNTKLVENVRRILARTNRLDALLAEVVRDVDAQDLDLRTVTDSDVLKNDNRLVRAAYTRQGWENTVRDRLEQPLDSLIGQEWVLGRSIEEAEQDREQQVAQLRSLYFDNYIREWKQFLGAIYLEAPADYLSAKRVFEDLTRGSEPPFARLSQYVRYHTHLPDAPVPEEEGGDLLDQAAEAGTKAVAKKGGKNAAKALDAGKKLLDKKKGARDSLLKTAADVEEAFIGLAKFGSPEPAPPAAEGAPPPPRAAVPLDRYQEELKRVRDALQAKIDHDGPEETTALINAVKTAKGTVDGLINESDTRGWSTQLQKWLPVPFNAVWQLAGESANADITSRWCSDVYQPFKTLQARYPFATKGREISIPVFVEFFRPETGKLWAYYNDALASRVPRKHDRFEIAGTGAASRTHLNPKVAEFLNRAHDVTTVMFPTGSDTMRVDMDVMISDNTAAAETTLEIDGKLIKHQNGPGRWQRMVWPGESDNPGAELDTHGMGVNGEIARRGAWGFFALLEAGTADGSATSDVFVVKWDLRDQDAGVVKIKFQPLEENTPFFGVRDRGVGFLEVFRHPDLTPPARIVVGGPSCSE